MNVIIVDLPTEQVILDETRFPDRDTSYIYEHLLHFWSLIPPAEPLPIVEVRAEANGPIITRGQKYLKIAQHLGRPFIRAAIDTTTLSYDAEATTALLQRPDVQQVDWQVIARDLQPVVHQWHVYFFERALQSDEKLAFERHLVEFFPKLFLRLKLKWEEQPIVSAVHYDDALYSAQFQAWTPVGIEDWYGEHLAETIQFSRQYAHVVSYQGLRFTFS